MKFESKRALRKRLDELETAYIDLYCQVKVGTPLDQIINTHNMIYMTPQREKMARVLEGS